MCDMSSYVAASIKSRLIQMFVSTLDSLYRRGSLHQLAKQGPPTAGSWKQEG